MKMRMMNTKHTITALKQAIITANLISLKSMINTIILKERVIIKALVSLGKIMMRILMASKTRNTQLETTIVKRILVQTMQIIMIIIQTEGIIMDSRARKTGIAIKTRILIITIVQKT